MWTHTIVSLEAMIKDFLALYAELHTPGDIEMLCEIYRKWLGEELVKILKAYAEGPKSN